MRKSYKALRANDQGVIEINPSEGYWGQFLDGEAVGIYVAIPILGHAFASLHTAIVPIPLWFLDRRRTPARLSCRDRRSQEKEGLYQLCKLIRANMSLILHQKGQCTEGLLVERERGRRIGRCWFWPHCANVTATGDPMLFCT